jgi:hypothetical protein
MIVPQHPARGFKGREQEVRNMRPHDRASGGAHRGAPGRGERQRGLGCRTATPPTPSRWKPW